MKSNHRDLPIYLKWEKFIPWLFQTASKFPKRLRLSFTQRIEIYALDILEDIVEACYIKNKLPILYKMNIKLEKIRLLIRMAYLLQIINTKAYEHALTEIDDVGRQIGGWIKQQGSYK